MSTVIVTVSVISYNSSRTITNTLKSIKSQTYPHIELIVSDDCSTDNTVYMAREWIARNGNRFESCKLITTPRNTGITGNVNRAIKQASGVWHKLVAADDVLLDDCIENIVNFVEEHPDVDFGFGKIRFKAADDYIKLTDSFMRNFFRYDYLNIDRKDFLYLILDHNFLPAASAFQRVSAIKELGYYDESIPMMEDWPMWMKAACKGYTFGLLDKEIADYYVSEQSTSFNPQPRFLQSVKMAEDKSLIYAKSVSKLLFLHLKMHRSTNRLLHILGHLNPVRYHLMRLMRRI